MIRPVEEQLQWIKRGAVDIVPEEDLIRKLERSYKEQKPLKIKLGCDPSRPDLHIGHAVVLRKLRQFQVLGHDAILVIGDFTGMIGDPSGRNKTRPPLTLEETRINGKTYFDQASKILDREKTRIVYNSEWLDRMNFKEVIQLASKYTVARMLERDDFEKRYRANEPISVHEFMYPLAQAMDSVALFSDVELGGTDQKFNLLVGRDIQREYNQEPQVILTMPVLEGTDGVQKMSKSLNNYIGLNDPPREMFGRIMSIPDNMIYKYFELATDVINEELKIIEGQLKDPAFNPSLLKRRLARDIIAMYHPAGEAIAAEEEFDRVFKNKLIPDDIAEFIADTAQYPVIKLLTETRMVESGNEARRQIQQGAVSINGEKISDEKLVISVDGELIIKVGKRKFLKVIPKK
jgi:tyrosyl-tRNA synthetase